MGGTLSHPSGRAGTGQEPGIGYVRRLVDVPFEDIYGARISRALDRHELPAVGVDHVAIGPESILEPHRHERAESLLFIVEGAATVTLDREIHHVTAGDFIYVPPNVMHGFETRQDSCRFLSIQSPPIYPIGEPADIAFE